MEDIVSGSSPSQVHTVTEPELARVLTDPVARRYYEPFLACSLSATAAAQEIGCALDTLLYRIRVFQKVGLLVVVEQQRRKGRAIKIYRTRFDAYFVPHQVTPFASLEERLYLMAEPHIRDWARSAAGRLQARGIEGVRLHRDIYGQVWSESAAEVSSLSALDPHSLKHPLRPPGFDVMTTLYLERQEAQALQQALAELLEAWRPKSRSGSGTPFNLNLFFSPEAH
ncbi:hypothetical protein GCM10022631_18020 [Deinococcus rubellus]|uniref:hypothetical protein n=1 Tax=Deinococcus rubellus TaxID=1889240 RepID=UPI0031E9277A